MTLILEMWRKGGYYQVDMPPVEKITSKMLETWDGKRCRLTFDDNGRRTIYAYGNAEAMWHDSEGLVTMDIPSFCHYWCYKLLELGIDVFSRVKLKEERETIMSVEGVTASEIAKVIDSRPDLYADFEPPDDF